MKVNRKPTPSEVAIIPKNRFDKIISHALRSSQEKFDTHQETNDLPPINKKPKPQQNGRSHIPRATTTIKSKIPQKGKIISPKRSNSRKSNIPRFKKTPTSAKQKTSPLPSKIDSERNMFLMTGTTEEENKIRARAEEIRKQTESLRERRYREVQFAQEDIELKRMHQSNSYTQTMSRLYYDSIEDT